MTATAILRVPLGTDLSGFVQLLQRLQMPHRINEEGDEQVLWVPESIGAEVLALYRCFSEGDPDNRLKGLLAPPVPSAPFGSGLVRQVRRSPVTAFVLVLTLMVGAITWLGDNLMTVHWFTFLDFRVSGDYLRFIPLADGLAAGQWWRLVTPMLLHFGFLHIAMNGLWYWELGKRIELRQGGLHLLGLTLLFSLVSNFSQYYVSGPSLFGGLSGVLYGLLGHCWIYQWLAPNPVYWLPRGVLAMMLIWLLVCLSGVISLIGFGEIANGAHVGGLLIGCFTGLLGGLWSRRKLAA
ncbi:rhomboid family intramembrane serine protease [Pseudomonas asplenii]|uniref:rhomboid family intramembrane serine protease n=1 Tax=Pseudomonas asplenii TaxID=53407 RepID=UPI00036EBDE7|nr:rhomboid family intramembrane serine protease [Pseudomonas fuscovaginae]